MDKINLAIRVFLTRKHLCLIIDGNEFLANSDSIVSVCLRFKRECLGKGLSEKGSFQMQCRRLVDMHTRHMQVHAHTGFESENLWKILSRIISKSKSRFM